MGRDVNSMMYSLPMNTSTQVPNQVHSYLLPNDQQPFLMNSLTELGNQTLQCSICDNENVDNNHTIHQTTIPLSRNTTLVIEQEHVYSFILFNNIRSSIQMFPLFLPCVQRACLDTIEIPFISFCHFFTTTLNDTDIVPMNPGSIQSQRLLNFQGCIETEIHVVVGCRTTLSDVSTAL